MEMPQVEGLFDLTNTYDASNRPKKIKQRKTGAYGLDYQLGDEMLGHNSPDKIQNCSIPAPQLDDNYGEDEFIISRR